MFTAHEQFCTDAHIFWLQFFFLSLERVDGRDSETEMFLYRALGTPLLENWVKMLVTKEEFRLEQVLRGATGMFKALEGLSYKKKPGEFGLLNPAK